MYGWKRLGSVAVRFIALLVVILLAAFGVSWLVGQPASGIPGAIVIGAGTLAATHILQRQREVEAAQWQSKIEAYLAFTDIIFTDIVAPIHRARGTGEEPNIKAADVTDRIYGLSSPIALWAGDDALRQYSILLDSIIRLHKDGSAHVVLNELSKMILVFRRDLGYRRGSVVPSDLFPLFGIPRDFTIRQNQVEVTEQTSKTIAS